MASSKKNKKESKRNRNPYQIIGYMTPYDNHSIISGIVMKDTESGVQFTATPYEVLNMVQNGKATLPTLDTVVAAP